MQHEAHAQAGELVALPHFGNVRLALTIGAAFEKENSLYRVAGQLRELCHREPHVVAPCARLFCFGHCGALTTNEATGRIIISAAGTPHSIIYMTASSLSQCNLDFSASCEGKTDCQQSPLCSM